MVKTLGFDHKTERGGVRAGIATPQDLDVAVTAMSAQYEGVFLVEEMVGEVVAELLVGVRRQWPVGWLVTLGAGGVLAELLDDLAHFLAPVGCQEVIHALETLKVGRLLAGYRGGAPADLQACAAVICDLVNGALGDGDVVEVEVNPLLVTASKAVAADALLSVTG